LLLNGKMCKIHEVQVSEKPTEQAAPGTFEVLNKKQLFVACSDFWLEVIQLQPEGKKKMTTDEFLRGHKIESIA